MTGNEQPKLKTRSLKTPAFESFHVTSLSLFSLLIFCPTLNIKIKNKPL